MLDGTPCICHHLGSPTICYHPLQPVQSYTKTNSIILKTIQPTLLLLFQFHLRCRLENPQRFGKSVGPP